MIFKNSKIELFPQVLSVAKRMHDVTPQIGCVNWDFTIDSSGQPVLIEMNLKNGSIWHSQMAHGCEPFGERTPEILRWMRIMKSMQPAERKRFRFGQV